MTKRFLLSLIVFFSFFSGVYAKGFALSAKASTLGMHFELYKSLSSKFNVHVGGAFFSYKYEGSAKTGEDYILNADLKMNNITALVDWVPFETSSFRISSGITFNNSKPNVSGTPSTEKVIGGDVYNKDNLGNLGIELSFAKVQPYIGLGFGNPADGETGIGFTFDVGAYYQGAPKVKLNATGLLAPSASEEQAAIVAKNIEGAAWYPVLSFGIAYKF